MSRTSRLVFVVGTGTGVGKTTLVEGWLLRLRADRVSAMGWKPVETGGDEDSRRLRAASSVAPPPTLVLREPISPHRAARLEGRALSLEALQEQVESIREKADVVVIETAGGLFTPLTDEGQTNADWVASCRPDAVVLVAANRLGCLHDVLACQRAFQRPFAKVVLTGRPAGDASASSNAEELLRWGLPVVSVEAPEDAKHIDYLY